MRDLTPIKPEAPHPFVEGHLVAICARCGKTKRGVAGHWRDAK